MSSTESGKGPDPESGLNAAIGKFSLLTAQMTDLLAEVSGEVEKSTEKLTRICSEIDRKKQELNMLLAVESAAAALEKLIESQRLQKEEFESLMEQQRRRWEEEKMGRDQEEREYLEALTVRRKNDEEECKRWCAAERLAAHQRLQSELLLVEQDRQAFERECQNREKKFEERELEWGRLVEELEQFMSQLSDRFHMDIRPSLRGVTTIAR